MVYQKLEYFGQLWHLQDTRPLRRTHTSDLYITQYQSQPAVLKIIRPESDEHHAAAILRYFNSQGAVKLFHSHDTGMLLECLEPEPVLKQMVADGKDDQATRIIADVIKDLHRPRRVPRPKNTKSLKQHFRALFAHAEPNSHFAYNKATDLADKLLAEEKDICVLHGDIHHENILHSDRGWLAIDPKGIIGERTYEVANTICNPYGLSDIVHSSQRIQRQVDIFASELGLDRRRILAFAYIHSCISICWSLEDRQDASYVRQSCKLLEKLVFS